MHTVLRHTLTAALCVALFTSLSPLALAKEKKSHAAASAPKKQSSVNDGETLTFGTLGTVHVYRTSPQPKNVVIFLSGDGGWNLGVIDMARALLDFDTLVVGVDVAHYLKQLESAKSSCSYPPGDLEALSQYLQKKYGYKDYVQPILVGYSSGATLVYSTLVQAPPNTFRGGLSLGFCPDLMIHKMMCKGHGLEWEPGPKNKGVVFQASQKLETPFVAFQGEIDKVCDPPSTISFIAQTKNAKVVKLPNVGHGYSVPRNWMPQFKDTFQQLASVKTEARGPAQLDNLPLVEMPLEESGDTFAIVLSGDGGWASIDRELAGAITAKGIPVVGWDSLHYYWTRRDPEQASKDLHRIIAHYAQAWGKRKVMLIGYSRGADVLPFLVNRLDEPDRQRVTEVALLGLSNWVDFEFKVSDWLPGAGEGSLDVIAEANNLSGVRTLCVFGADEKDTACRNLDRKRITVAELPGGHHFAGNYDELARVILDHHDKTP